MTHVKQHAIKLLMVSVIGLGLTGCIGSLCNAALGTKKGTVASSVSAPVTTAGITGGVAAGDMVTTPTDICK